MITESPHGGLPTVICDFCTTKIEGGLDAWNQQVVWCKSQDGKKHHHIHCMMDFVRGSRTVRREIKRIKTSTGSNSQVKKYLSNLGLTYSMIEQYFEEFYARHPKYAADTRNGRFIGRGPDKSAK